MKTLSKIIAITFMLVLFVGNSFSQDINGGTVKYEQISKFDHGLKAKDRPNSQRYNDFIKMLPKTLKLSRVLYFDSNYSLFEEDPNPEAVAPMDQRTQGMVTRVQMGMPPQTKILKVYTDHKKNKNTVQYELMSRYFRIESKNEKIEWKIGTKQRKVQGYTCMEATTKKDGKTISAWFAPSIPISIGPEYYSGLPGLILAVDVDGFNILLATSVDLSAPAKDNIYVPKDGKKVSQKAYDQIYTEKVAEHQKIREDREKAARRGEGGRGQVRTGVIRK